MDEQPARNAGTSQESVNDATNAAPSNANDRTEVIAAYSTQLQITVSYSGPFLKSESLSMIENPISNG